MTNLVFNVGADCVLPYDWGDTGAHRVLQCPSHYDELAFSFTC
jgi:hypothetical protein